MRMLLSRNQYPVFVVLVEDRGHFLLLKLHVTDYVISAHRSQGICLADLWLQPCPFLVSRVLGRTVRVASEVSQLTLQIRIGVNTDDDVQLRIYHREPVQVAPKLLHLYRIFLLFGAQMGTD